MTDKIKERAKSMMNQQLKLMDVVYRVSEYVYKIRSSEGNIFHTITITDNVLDCDCPYMSHKGVCKHIELMIMLFKGEAPIRDWRDLFF